MGVCINYRGKLKSPQQVFKLIEEMEDICQTMEWKYTIIQEDWTKPSDVHFVNDPITNHLKIEGDAYLKGIIFTPIKCESMQLLFDKNGTLTSLIQKAFENSLEDYQPTYQWTKTQFAGADVHITLIKLLKYLQKKYMPDLDVKDEGEYWETEDRAKLERNLGIIDAAIQLISDIAENSDSVASFLEKLEKWLTTKENDT